MPPGLPTPPRDDPRLAIRTGWVRGVNSITAQYYSVVPYAGGSNGVLVLDRMFVFPLYVGARTFFDSIAVACIGVASSFIRFVAYSDNGGAPDKLVFDSGQVDSSGAAFLPTPFNRWFEGIAWVGCVGQGVAPSVKRMTNVIAHPMIGTPNANSVPEGSFYYLDSISGLPPVSFGTTLNSHASGSQVPVVYVRAK